MQKQTDKTRAKDRRPFRISARAGRKFLTKTEEERAWCLYELREKSAILDFYIKPFKLRLTGVSEKGGKALTYEPDFAVVRLDGSMCCEEVKKVDKKGKPIYLGDARTKVLTASRLFPCFYFTIIWRFRSEWFAEEL